MIDATTMVDAEQRRDDTPCRLCLESIASLETAGVDLLENTDVKKLLHDVYELKILPNDNKSTMMCMPCYQQLMHHYTLRMKLLMLRKTFRINQTMMLTQINAFNGTCAESSASKLDESETTAEQEKTTKTATTASTPTPTPPLSTQVPATMKKELEKAPEENEVTKVTSSKPATNATTEMVENQLIPIVLDCLKDPLYRSALSPLVVSTDRKDPAPLVLLCSTCHNSFKAKEKFDQHRSKGCVPCCRYCLAEMTADHHCPFLNKYSSVIPQIVGSRKYVTTVTIPDSAVDDDDAAAAPVEPPDDECEEPKSKKRNLGERFSSVDRRSVTPNPRKREKSNSSSTSSVSSAKNLKSSESQSQPKTTLPTTLDTMSRSSSESDALVTLSHRKSAADKSAVSSRKRKR